MISWGEFSTAHQKIDMPYGKGFCIAISGLQHHGAYYYYTTELVKNYQKQCLLLRMRKEKIFHIDTGWRTHGGISKV